jgi:excisionase family DNA binding protein
LIKFDLIPIYSTLSGGFMENQVYTVKQVSKRLMVSEGTIRNHIKSGKIPATRIGGDTGDYRIPITWVDTFLSDQTEFNQ